MDADTLLVGALLWNPSDCLDVLALVEDTDIESPHLASVLATLRSMVGAGKPVHPHLVGDQLRRAGVHRTVLRALMDATTSGAVAESAREWAAAVVARSYRRQIASAAAALSASEDRPEGDVVDLVARIALRTAQTAQRLALLRGEEF